MMDRHMSSHKLQQLIERQEELNYFANQQQQLNFVTEEHINQLNDVCHGLTQEVADLKNGKLAAEARLVSLEQIVDQQQEQISRLKGASGSLASELSALQLQQGSLAEDHETLCDCLLGADVVRPLQMSERRAALRSQRLLLSVLTERPSGRLLRQLAGDSVARLPAASRRFRGCAIAEPAAAEAGTPSDDSACVACSLDDGAWSRLGQYEPSPAALDKWAASGTVSKLLGSCVIEAVAGGGQALRFTDVYRLLSEMGLTMDELVHRFAKGVGFRHHHSGRCVQRTANEILRRFASQPVGGRKVMRFRDIYRLLEIIGYTLERFEKIFASCSDPDISVDGKVPVLGKYRICRSIGSGNKGVCFLAESTADSTKAAVKWPVQDAEVRALEDIKARLSPSNPGLGLPRLLATGEYQQQKYVVTELLGSSLYKVFQRLEGQTPERRWTLLSVFGRLMVRNLRSLHMCGLVHCDVSPENIVLGPAKPKRANGSTWIAPYFVDFGHAQKFPGGAKLASDKGSIEWSSIRSALGAEPLPMDDLQALGWVLVNGLFGTLPWVRWLQWAYKDWESRWTRGQVVRQVQRAKSRLLESGWVAAGWPRGAKVPEELDLFLHACWCKDGETEGRGAMRAPDYSALLLLLGGSPELSEGDAEEQDLRLLTQRMAPLMP